MSARDNYQHAEISFDHWPEMIDVDECRKELRKLTAQYSRKLLKNYKNLDSGEPEAAHDLRVMTRRLQAILDLISPGKPKGKSRKARSRLKRLRHAIGSERDLEIMLGRARQCSRRAASSSRRKLWKHIEHNTCSELDQAIKQARWKVEQIQPQSLPRLIERVVQKSLKSIDTKQFVEAIAKSRDKLANSISTAIASKGSDHYHDVRIKAKSLRYTLELLSQLYPREDKSQPIELLKSAQDELGDWHDEVELCRRATGILSGTPDLQADQIATAMLDFLRSQTRHANDHAREVIISLASQLLGTEASRDSGQNERKRLRADKA